MFLQYGDLTDTSLGKGGMEGLAMLVMGLLFFFVVFLLLLILSIYSGLTLMKTAKRLNVEPAWLAWIPIANFYLMLKMAKMNPLLMLVMIGFIIPFVNNIAIIAFSVISIIAQWKICEARQRPGWWALLLLIPFVGWIWYFIMWGILAWGK